MCICLSGVIISVADRMSMIMIRLENISKAFTYVPVMGNNLIRNTEHVFFPQVKQEPIVKKRKLIINCWKNTALYQNLKFIKNKYATPCKKLDSKKVLNDFKHYRDKNDVSLYEETENYLKQIINYPNSKNCYNVPEFCYHGTNKKAAEAIRNSGFNLSKENYAMKGCIRELGKGIYLSPHAKIAGKFGENMLRVKIDASKIGGLDYKDWRAFYGKLWQVACNYGQKKRLTIREFNALHNELFRDLVLNIGKDSDNKSLIQGVCVDGMFDIWDSLNIRKIFKIPCKNKTQIAIYNQDAIKDIK